MKSVEDRLIEKLGLSADEFNCLFTNCPVNGHDGYDIADEIAKRFGLGETGENIAWRLWEAGIINSEEWACMEDAD